MSKKTNPQILNLIKDLHGAYEQHKAGIWLTAAKALEAASKSHSVLSLKQLNMLTEKNEKVLVLGKILGTGSLEHALEVYSFCISKSALEGIKKSKGTYGTVEELIKKHPDGSKIKILK